ncbi:hypothetical protein VCJ71_08205 [Alteriqipengyuania sp. WL0013]|uniref:hypothetical protein n=1 Tax=Alteriqipengyuania sp. WL0013 TaxID=3110773 RepID=UPI002CE8A089|nr:hypothetical protein [Alteriqipengyuania sp. WL0013]MEB3416044.1 hypothetical protein [Alteriqipengyuania sp. WL0013]
MLTLFGVFMVGFLGWRAFLYFRSGKPIAGGAACLGIGLFGMLLWVQYAKSVDEARGYTRAEAIARAETGAESANSPAEPELASDEPVIGDFDASKINR